MYKSPIKTPGKLPAHSIDRTKQKTKLSGVSASKKEGQIKREVFNNQVYKNVLSRMLSKNSIEQFLEETSKFIILTDPFSKSYQRGHYFTKNSQDFPELGRAMLKDGSFIRHYCKLLIMKEPEREVEFKKYFYEAYKNEICQKKAYFETYFKVQIKEESVSISQSHRKVSSKKDVAEFSWKKNSKSLKKVLSESCFKPPQQLSESLYESPKFYEQASNSAVTCTTIIEHHNKSKIKQSLDNVEEETSQSFKYSYCCRSTGRKKNETEEARERRLMGLVDVSAQSKKSEKSAANIIKFVDQLESNKRLKEIYESVKKEREEQKHLQTPSQKKMFQKSPLIRQTYHNKQKQWEKIKLHSLTPEILSKLTTQERKVLQFYPNITKYGFTTHVKKESPVVIGYFDDKILMKCFVTDLFQYLQPSYISVYLSQSSTETNVADFDYQIDRTVEVLLIQEQSAKEQNPQ